MNNQQIKFPVGYEKFHGKKLFNFQLNRPYSFGYADFNDLKEVGSRNNSFESWKREMLKLSEKADLQLNEENIHSELVKQDVLILTSRNDHFIPFKMHEMQLMALVNAKSVTGRIFTKEEHAENHCQTGNLELALKTMIEWIECK